MNYPVLDLKATGERINQLRKDNNLRVTDVAEYMGFESTQAVYKWQRGESLPTIVAQLSRQKSEIFIMN